MNQIKINKIVTVDALLRAAVPCTGVSIGSFEDKSTWRVDFLPEATKKQKAAAQEIIDNFDNSLE